MVRGWCCVISLRYGPEGEPRRTSASRPRLRHATNSGLADLVFRACRTRWLASSRGDAGVVTPGWHRGHICQGLAFDLGARCARVAPGLPGGHSLEPLLKGLELAGLVGAVAADRPVSIGIPQLSQAGVVLMMYSLGRAGRSRGRAELPTERARGARPRAHRPDLGASETARRRAGLR